MIKYFMFIMLALILSSCGSHPVLPTTKDITVSREAADKDCRDLGMIEGRSTKINATSEEVLEDLKKESVRKGANYVKVETMGAMNSALRGRAYFCE